VRVSSGYRIMSQPNDASHAYRIHLRRRATSYKSICKLRTVAHSRKRDFVLTILRCQDKTIKRCVDFLRPVVRKGDCWTIRKPGSRRCGTHQSRQQCAMSVLSVAPVSKDILRFPSQASHKVRQRGCQGEAGSAGAPINMIADHLFRVPPRFFIASGFCMLDDFGDVFIGQAGKCCHNAIKQ